MEPSWVESIITEAIEKRMCTRVHCTTCGAGQFRSRVFAKAMDLAGLEVQVADRIAPRQLLAHLSMEELAAIFEQVVSGLRDVNAVSGQELPALRTILEDLDPPLMKWGVVANLSDCLEGSFVGEQYDSIRAHSAMMAEFRAEREEYESPEAAKERREGRRAKSAQTHQRRLEEKTSRDRERDLILAELAALPGVDRLARVLGKCSDLPLDAIPDHLIPLDAELSGLDDDTRERLITEIDRRRGTWQRLRKQLIAIREQEGGSIS